MNKLTDAEILKTLDFCEGYNGVSFCNDCPLFDKDNCIHILSHEASGLINRQKAEIERLREGIKFERERVDNIPNLLLQAKSEARKEFAEKVIHEIVNRPSKIQSTSKEYLHGSAYRQNEIIDLLTEMEGGTE